LKLATQTRYWRFIYFHGIIHRRNCCLT
jgi:hypothetical protein